MRGPAKSPCETCGYIHVGTWVYAQDRFDEDKPTTYRAIYRDAPKRDTRAEAEADMCTYLMSAARGEIKELK